MQKFWEKFLFWKNKITSSDSTEVKEEDDTTSDDNAASTDDERKEEKALTQTRILRCQQLKKTRMTPWIYALS